MPSKRDKDATRSERKAKRRAAEDQIPDVPGENEENDAEEVNDEQPKDKKRKRKDVDDKGKTSHGDSETRPSKKSKNNGEDVSAEQESARKSKKERKAERKALKAAEKGATEEAGELDTTENPETEVEVATTTKSKKKSKTPKEKTSNEEEKSTKTPPRFVVFVGNLPFTATKESILKHFAKLKPKEIRLLTEKDNPSKSRGIAFIEFEGYDSMKTCLKLMHHSEFNDGISAARKINVELTAGGGGKSKVRTEKIKVKNHKLQEERLRRVQDEEKVKDGKRGEGNLGDIHPSRRGRLGMDE